MSKILKVLSLLLALALLLQVPVTNLGITRVNAATWPDDYSWPMFLHDAKHTGISQFTVTSSTGGVVFSPPTGEKFLSSPVIDDEGRILIGTDQGNFYAISPYIGSGGMLTIDWTFKPTEKVIFESTAAIDRYDNIYVGAIDGKKGIFFKLSSTGTRLWSFDDGGNLGPVESSAVIGPDDTIYFGSDNGYLYALTSTGSLKWKYQTGGYVKSSPALSDDGTIYVGSYGGYLYAIRPNGTLKWRQLLGQIYSSPVIGPDGTIYVGCLNDSVYAVRDLGTTATILWSYTTGNDIYASPVLSPDGSTVYVVSRDNWLYALRASNGTLKWKYYTAAAVDSTPVLDKDGRIFLAKGGLTGSDKYLIALSDAGTTYTELWRYYFPSGWSNAAPAIAKGKNGLGALIAVSWKHIIAIGELAPGYYTISASASPGGSIDPVGTVTVAAGATIAFNITASPGYYVSHVMVDGTTTTYPVNTTATSYIFPNVQADHAITAYFTPYVYTIVSSAGVGGSISPAGTATVAHGSSSATYTITASEGWHIKSILVDGEPLTGVGATATSYEYKFTSVTADQTIHVVFERNVYEIIASAGVGGSIDPAGTVTVAEGTATSFVITASEGWYVDYVVVDATVVEVDSLTSTTFWFYDVMANHVISAVFVPLTSSEDYVIIASAGAGGSINPVGAVTVAQETSTSFTITANEGWYIDYIVVNGNTIAVPPDTTATTYTFGPVTATLNTVHAVFANYVYTIVSSAGVGGSISPAGTATVAHGSSSATYTITASEGWHIKSILVDGEPLTGVGATATSYEYKFTSVTADQTIHAVFERNVYEITASAGEGGNIAPTGTVAVAYGDEQTFVFTASPGWHIKQVYVDGATVGPEPYYTFYDVSADHTIYAEFERDARIILASAGVGGSINPAGTVTVNYGDPISFTITPSAGYHIADVKVDGVSIGATTSYTFTNVTGNHTIEALFAINQYTITANITGNGVIVLSYGSNTSTLADGATIVLPHGTTVSVEGVPATGWSKVSVTPTSFTVDGDRVVEVVFALIPPPQPTYYTITAIAGVGGSISPAGAVTVPYGGSQTFTITPSAGYHIADVKVDGVSIGATTSYTFTSVTGSHTIEALFAINEYTITAITGTGGSISPAGAVTVPYGGSQTFTITPSAGYHIADVKVDGVSIGATTSYTFTNVTGNHTIEALFAKDSDIQVRIAIPTGICGRVYTKFVLVFENGSAPYTYTVDFGDGTNPITGSVSGNVANIVHAYPQSGTFLMWVTVTDTTGKKGAEEAVIIAGECLIVESVYHHNFVFGYPDGTFRPESKITRAELAAMISRALALDTTIPQRQVFSDLGPNHWAYPFVMAMYREGLMKGYPEGTFGPDQYITRAEVATVLARVRAALGGTVQAFRDVDPAKWYAPYVNASVQEGLILGYEDGTFRPEIPITRAEMVVVLTRVLYREDVVNVASSLAGVTVSWPDVSPNYWAYGYIVEASIPHLVLEAARVPVNLNLPSKMIPVYLPTIDSVTPYPELGSSVRTIVPVDGVVNGLDPLTRDVQVKIINLQRP
ncbi:PQQ-binding-like beta-propeller repeat protein [Coprothermobacteraceae bacterium]|nr:PQQ-binding-like beta-propeller repeat protein [Coprothermobacteraceae bacterium]